MLIEKNCLCCIKNTEIQFIKHTSKRLGHLVELYITSIKFHKCNGILSNGFEEYKSKEMI